MLKTTWKTEYQGHVIELENRPSLERLIVMERKSPGSLAPLGNRAAFTRPFPTGTGP